MRRLVIFLVIIGALGTGGDIGARKWAEGQIESRARAELPNQVAVSAHIKAFPFLPPLFIAGKVSEAGGHFENVPAAPLTLSAVDVVLHGVRVNRKKLINERKVELVSIDEGTVTAEITAAVLSKVLGLPVTIANGELKLAGVGVPRLTVKDNALVFGGARIVAIPKTRLVPCATSVTILANRVRLSCTVKTIPAGMLGEANRELNR